MKLNELLAESTRGARRVKDGTARHYTDRDEWLHSVDARPELKLLTADEAQLPPYGSGTTTLHAVDDHGRSVGYFSDRP